MTVLLAQLSVTLTFERLPEKQSVSVAAHWLHPLILRAAFDAQTGATEVWLFGAVRIFPARSQESPPNAFGHEASGPPAASPSSADGGNGPERSGEMPDGNTGSASPGEEDREENQVAGAAAPQDAPSERVTLGQRLGIAAAKIKKSSWMRTLMLIRQTSWRSKILRWCKRCLGSLPGLVSFHSADLHVWAGLSDPALTGGIFGCWTGMHGALSARKKPRFALTVEPVFTEDCLFIKGSVSFRSSLMRFAVLPALAIGTFPYLSTIKAWRRSRR